MEKLEWKLVPHFHQIADTGDYDGCYELTNGAVSIFTKNDNDEGLEEIIKTLNESGAEFYLDDSKDFELHLEKQKTEELTKERDSLLHGSESWSMENKKLLSKIAELQNKVERAVTANESILRCVEYYRDIDKDREGADPEKRLSKLGMIDVLNQMAEGQSKVLNEK